MNFHSAESSAVDAQPVELYRITHGLSIYCYTSADKAQTHLSETYVPEAISRTQVDQSQEDHAGSLTLTLPRENPVAALFIAYLPPVPVRVTIYRRHRNGTQTVQAFAGSVSSAVFRENECELRCAADTEVLSRIIPIAVYQPQCNHVLYSRSKSHDLESGSRAQTIGCNVNKDAFRTSVTIHAASGLNVAGSGFSQLPAGYFTYGYVERALDGDVRWITSHSGANIVLSYPFPDLAPGETLHTYPGCDGLERTCREKFNNVINFGGFTRMPAKNPFAGSIQ